MKHTTTIWWIIGVIAVIGGLFGWSRLTQPNDPGVIAQNGLHWHPTLTMYVRGEEVKIPRNIGVGAEYQGMLGYGEGGMAMTPIHTHDDVPIIHLEHQGTVLKEDITLGTFFSVWGKDMRSFGSNMHMKVNGKENTEYENYMMRDGDVIELHYD